MPNIDELKKQVEELQKKNTAVIRERAEVARLEAIIKLESNPVLLNAKVNLAMKEEQTQSLQRLVDECAGIIANVPIYNAKTRTQRIWAGNHRYNYGQQIDLLYQLATGILYACQEHKQLLLAHVPVNLETLEQFVQAFGTPSYYSRNYHVIVEAKPANLEALRALTEVLQSQLSVVLDTSALTEKNIEAEFVRAEMIASQAYEAAVEAIAEADFAL